MIKERYQAIDSFSEGYAAVMENSKWGYIDIKGRVVIKPQFDYCYEFSENLAAVQIEDKWGYINKYGDLVISSKFDKANSFYEGFASVLLGKEMFYINTSGNIAIDLLFEFCGYFSDGWALVKLLSGEEVFINKSGEVVLDKKSIKANYSFDFRTNFDNDLVEIESNGQLGYCNRNGVIIWEPTK